MKYFIANIQEKINGYETIVKKVIHDQTFEQAEKKLMDQVKTWRGEANNFTDKTAYFDDGIEVTGHIEKAISQLEGEILAKYI